MSNQNKKIDEIVKLLLHDDNIIGISLVGSFIKYNDYNDLDFLVVSTKKNVTINLIKDNFRLYDVGFNDDSIRVKNYMNKEIGFGLYDKKNMDDRLCNYLNGKNLDPIYKNWNIVGSLPVCFVNVLSIDDCFENVNNFIDKIKEDGDLVQFYKNFYNLVFNSNNGIRFKTILENFNIDEIFTKLNSYVQLNCSNNKVYKKKKNM